MKPLIAALIAATPFMAPITVSAEHLDVIIFEMTGKCSMEKYMDIVSDFNEWGAEHNYVARVAAPVQSGDIDQYVWMGTTPDNAAFGAATDLWLRQLNDPKTTPAKLMARFNECTKIVRRSGYMVY